VRDRAIATLSFVDDVQPEALTFVTTAGLARAAAEHADVSAVITTRTLASHIPDDVGLLVVGDPVRVFYALHNALAASTSFYGERWPSVVHPTAIIDATAHIDPWCVEIGPGCVIGPGAVVQGNVRVGPRTRVDANAVIGASAFQRSGPDHGDLEMVHVGGVEIGSDCHIYAHAVIARGQLAPPTTIGDGTHIGNGAFVSHRCQLGRAVSIGHNATVNGRVTVGDESWIGPGAVIAHRLDLGAGCNVALGASVMQDVAPGEEVAGLPALRKHQMFRHAASIKRSTEHPAIRHRTSGDDCQEA
jgi:UDP-3-O-[3-hydroxymyristoyl] glucosamine N-acyltransferase